MVASQNARLIGFDNAGEITAEFLKLKREEFYKSMTSNRNHKVWQDVYHHQCSGLIIYVKFLVEHGVVILSFKEK